MNMHATLQFLIRHGYAILFAAVFLEQTGFPVPSVPVLLGVGALAAEGRFSLGMGLLVALAASLPADAVWYDRGRRHHRQQRRLPGRGDCLRVWGLSWLEMGGATALSAAVGDGAPDSGRTLAAHADRRGYHDPRSAPFAGDRGGRRRPAGRAALP